MSALRETLATRVETTVVATLGRGTVVMEVMEVMVVMEVMEVVEFLVVPAPVQSGTFPESVALTG